MAVLRRLLRREYKKHEIWTATIASVSFLPARRPCHAVTISFCRTSCLFKSRCPRTCHASLLCFQALATNQACLAVLLLARGVSQVSTRVVAMPLPCSRLAAALPGLDARCLLPFRLVLGPDSPTCRGYDAPCDAPAPPSLPLHVRPAPKNMREMVARCVCRRRCLDARPQSSTTHRKPSS